MPPQQDPTGAAFGAGFGEPWDASEDPLADPPAEPPAPTEEPPAPPAAEEPAVPPAGQEAAPEATPEAQPEAQDVQPTGQEGQEEPQPEAQPGERLYANRFQTTEALESGYDNLRALQIRTAEARNAAAARADQLEALIYEQLAPFLDQQQQPQQQGQPGESTIPPMPHPDQFSDPGQYEAAGRAWAAGVREQVKREAILETQQMLRQELGGQQAQQQAQWQAQQSNQMTNAAVAAFREKHPDITSESPEEYAVVDAMRAAQLWPTDPASIERGYEIAQNPDLRTVVQAMPALAQNEEGMVIARRFAGMEAASAQNAAATGGAPRVTPAQAKAAKQAAHVESGTRGPAPAAKPKDVIDEMFEEEDERSKSAFFKRS